MTIFQDVLAVDVFTNVCVVCVAYLAKYQSLSTVIKRGDNRGNTLWENVPTTPHSVGFFCYLWGYFIKKHSKNLVIITFFVG